MKKVFFFMNMVLIGVGIYFIYYWIDYKTYEEILQTMKYPEVDEDDTVQSIEITSHKVDSKGKRTIVEDKKMIEKILEQASAIEYKKVNVNEDRENYYEIKIYYEKNYPINQVIIHVFDEHIFFAKSQYPKYKVIGENELYELLEKEDFSVVIEKDDDDKKFQEEGQSNAPKILHERLPFNVEDIKEIYIIQDNSRIDLEINQERLIKQSIIEEYKSSEEFRLYGEVILITVETENDTFTYPYNIATNTIGIPNESNKIIGYYQEDSVYMLMVNILDSNKESILKDFSHLQQKADKEVNFSNNSKSVSNYNNDILYVNNLNQIDWEKQLETYSVTSKVTSFNYCIGSLVDITTYQEGIINLSNSEMIFYTEEYVLANKIKVGDSTAKVLSEIGVPNYKVDSEWSYSVNGYIRVRLLIENDKVKYIILTTPC
ncbi:hypothetical protein IM538_14715 [Cytobacillus suaedae]|nr:hypothetical protein IM538_14715 [Cytobacillus suaedae]